MSVLFIMVFDSSESVSILMFAYISNGKTQPLALSGVLTLITPGGLLCVHTAAGESVKVARSQCYNALFFSAGMLLIFSKQHRVDQLH